MWLSIQENADLVDKFSGGRWSTGQVDILIHQKCDLSFDSVIGSLCNKALTYPVFYFR